MTSQRAETSTDADSTTQSDQRLACEACGQIHKDARLVRLPDGQEVGNYSEAYRLHCEAAWVLRKKRTKRTRLEYLDAVAEKRGPQARVDLRAAMLKLWESKN